ncbi:MAG: transaldolase [Candidatus Nanopelagicales bacterium]|nr:transaldolase [Candidatus Nanopelagicales bacterium]MCF8536599.1 transaldolase [Candidatus Nanopelagicales bacterium]MCF8541632.1 transaldolase [Candidatus Nanopelagicales bacterium]MCF8556266.1 transaldolase [Candidatus Nanopelagicales bacterium]
MSSAPQANLQDLTAAGVSVWLDDLDRTRITSGQLADMITIDSVRGVTTNPTIFEKAISGGAAAYADQLAALANAGSDVDSIIRSLTTDDVRAACDVFLPLFETSNGEDGRVSIEVDPRLAHDTEATVDQARQLWAIVDRPNALIKIPATPEGLPAITEVIGSGISVNVTLIFSVERYDAVVEAYVRGLELALERGHDLTRIRSVASFFISRIDTEVDGRLRDIESPAAQALHGEAAIATGRLVWQAHLESTRSPRWAELERAGAHRQRPLWASTGVKDPTMAPTRYVLDLVVRGCVNTMPEATLRAVADNGPVPRDTVDGTFAASAEVWSSLESLGISQADVSATLEAEGVTKFIDSWEQLRGTVSAAAGL